MRFFEWLVVFIFRIAGFLIRLAWFIAVFSIILAVNIFFNTINGMVSRK